CFTSRDAFLMIEETFRVKHEDTEEQRKLAFIKEESKDMKTEETFRVKEEETEEQTDLMALKEESGVLNEMEEKKHDFINGEKYFSCSQSEKTSLINKTQKTSNYTCQQCEKCFNQTESITRHKSIHTREKPYACRQCGKHFGHRKSLKRH
ncbi:hypothetical protein QQF64_018422, partial [Cirrhinus molitorella]